MNKYWMSDSLSIQLKRLNKDTLEKSYDIFVDYIEAYKKMLVELKPEQVAHSFHCEIDKAIKKDMKKDKNYKKISCTKGCSYCCKIDLAINEEEAIILLMYIKDLKLKLDWDKVTRQAKVEGDNWQDLALKDRSCIFLNKKGECKVYKFRPGACRKYFVVSDPEQCNMEGKYTEVKRFGPVMSEIIFSAMLNGSPTETLPRQLLKMKESQNG